MKGTAAKRDVWRGSCVSTGAKFPVAPVESEPICTFMFLHFIHHHHHRVRLLQVVKRNQHTVIAQYDSLIID